MFEGFEPFTVTTSTSPEVIISGLKRTITASSSPSSSKPPLLLLHGFPQTYHIWHRVTPQLLSHYDNIILMDLRGYGSSSKPSDVSDYAKSAMARDCIAVMDKLCPSSASPSSSPFYVCAHDRGARVAHKLAVDFPDRVKGLILLDICPTLAMYTKTDFDFAKAYFHWFMLIQAEPLPETLISASPRKFAELFMGGRQAQGLGVFEASCYERYVSVLEDPAAVHAMCNDYRASSTLDLDEARQDIASGRLLRCPVRVLWGKYGVIEKSFDAVAEWKAVATPGVPVDGHAVESGHYIPEAAPDDVVSAVLDMFK